MIKFSKFIVEAAKRDDSSPKKMADEFMRMFSKLVKKEYTFVDAEDLENKYGKLVGYLYVNMLTAIRVNFKDNVIHSFSKWDRYNNSTPDLTVILKNKTKLNKKGLVDMYSDISIALCRKSIYDGPGSRGIRYIELFTGDICTDIDEAVCTLFDNGFTIDAIREIMKRYRLTEQEIYSFLRAGNYALSDEGDKTAEDYYALEGSESQEPGKSEESGKSETIGDVEVVPAVEETVEDTESMKQNQEELAAQLIADPLPVFRQLNTYVLMVARGLNNALLITGQGGVGKSYNVNRILSAYGQKGKDYVIMKGKSTVSAMYQFLYDNYNKIVVFDDCDSIIQNSDGMNILKGVLDSGRIREVSWNARGSDIVDTFGCESHEEVEAKLKEWSAQNRGKKGRPNYFQFEGAIIFISNLNRDAFEDALLTRCTAVDINLLAEEVILRMESVLPSIKIYSSRGQDITNDDMKQEVFDYISSSEFLEDPRIKGKQISFRLFNKAYMFRYACLPNWKELSFCI